MSLKNLAQIAKRLPDDQGIGVLVPKLCGGHSPWLDVGVAVTFGNDQDHPAAKGTIVLVLPVVVPWAFRNAKALQGITKDWGNQVQLDKCPRSILPQPSENKDRVNKLCISTWVQK